MKNKYFLSLNAKIFLSLFISIACIFAFFMSTFMISYVGQLEQEAELARRKLEAISELYNENDFLRKNIQKIQKENPFVSLKREGEFILKHQDERDLYLKKEILTDLREAKKRNYKIDVLKYVVFFSFMFIFVVLELQWLIVRRLVLKPIENLTQATHKLSSGDLNFRIPVSSRYSQNDELDLLARDFNKMAEDIEKYVQNIKENESFLQNLIDSIPDGIRVFDSQYQIILVNAAYKKMTEIKDNAVGRKCFEAYGNTCPCPSSQHPCTLALLTEHPEKPINVIQKYTDKEGREKFVEVSAVASEHLTESGGKLRIIELVRPLDKTILFSHQQKLSAVGMLASSVAHEMRNPLGSVRLILENILDKMNTKPMSQEDLKHYLTLINTQIETCIDVTSRLLKLSRKPEKEKRPVNLNEVVRETVSLLEYEAKKIGVEVVVRETEKDALILASDTEMRMIIVNLMQNAFHVMPDGGRINIKVMLDDKFVRIDVSDTGKGIEPENLPRIFEPFFTKSASPDSEGTGLGLSIVKTIVEEHNGAISVESTLGQGTTFHLCFAAIG